MNKPTLFGVPIDPLTPEGAVAEIVRYVAERVPRQAVFLNASKYMEMDRDPALRGAVMAADLRLADGQSVVWACRFLGLTVPPRVAGVDLMMELLDHGARHGWRFYFLGARDEALAQAVVKCEWRYPGLVMAGWRNGYFSEAEEESVASAIRDARPDVLFVGISSPQKEIFMERWGARMGVPFSMGVGGSFDVVAGVVRRAPQWMQNAGLEWLFRLGQEPRRLFWRYAAGHSLFIVNTLKARFGL